MTKSDKKFMEIIRNIFRLRWKYIYFACGELKREKTVAQEKKEKNNVVKGLINYTLACEKHFSSWVNE